MECVVNPQLAFKWVRTIPGDNRLFTRRIFVLAGILAVLNQRLHRVLIHTWNPVIV
jgi:hypothetical protein